MVPIAMFVYFDVGTYFDCCILFFISRNTPTSAGPNSYNKGKLGFTNRNKMWDREMKPRIHLEKPPDSE